MKLLPFNFNAPMTDMQGAPLYIPSPAADIPSQIATFKHFALQALQTVYSGEENSLLEVKFYRLALAEKISLGDPVFLTFPERALLLELVNRCTRAPIVILRFSEFLEEPAVPLVQNDPPT